MPWQQYPSGEDDNWSKNIEEPDQLFFFFAKNKKYDILSG